MSDWLFLAVAIWCAAFSFNALRPSRHPVGFVPSFFASWMTIELAEIHIVWESLVGVLFISGGAADSVVGKVAAAILATSIAALVVIVVQSRRTGPVLDELLGPHGTQRPFVRPRRRQRPARLRNIEYTRAGGQSLSLDVYLPDGPSDGGVAQGAPRRPAVMQIHGGAWVVGSKREQGLPLLRHLARNGWVGFNVDYRLSPAATWPDHLVDLKRALAWIREHADEYGVDPDFVAVTGGSAGGHLCAMVALTADDSTLQPGFEDADCSVQAAVPFYGVYDFTNRTGAMGDLFITRFLQPLVMKSFYADDPERYAAASPMSRVHAGAPPFLVLHGDRDVLAPVADAREFVRLLREVSHEPVLYGELHGAQHAFDLFHSTRASRVIHTVERFLAWAHDRHEHAASSSTTEVAEELEAELGDEVSAGAAESAT